MKHTPPNDVKKSAALKSNVPVVKSPVPAVRDAIRDFDDWMKRGEFLLHISTEYVEPAWYVDDEESPTQADLDNVKYAAAFVRGTSVQEAARIFDAGWEWFNHDKLYEPCPSSPDLLNVHSNRVLTQSTVRKMLATAFATINQEPKNKEEYGRTLVRVIIAAKPSAPALQAACREIATTMTFLPSEAELLKILREQMEKWGALLEVDVEEWRARFDDYLIPKLQAKLIEREAQEKQREHERQENIARYARERDERIAREAAEKQARLEKAEQERQARRVEFQAYRAQRAEAEAFRDWFKLLMISLGIFIGGQHVRYAARRSTVAWYVTRLAKGFHPEPSETFVRILVEEVAAELPPVTVAQLEAACGFVLRWEDSLSVASVLATVREAQVQAGARLPPRDDDDEDYASNNP
jgi:hypothetical protein